MFRWFYPIKADRRRLERFARRRPWKEQPPQDAGEPLRLRGMLRHDEALLFYHLARDAYAGRGAIVDAGSFLGKSASLFATGLLGNHAARKAQPKVHCFDNFVVNEAATVDFIQEHFGRHIAVGHSTRELFEEQVRPVRGMLEVHAGDFLQARWPDVPIEILMVDIAKSPRLLARVLTEMFPRLVPGASLVVHQDYHHPWLPHIHVTMERLKDHFELLVPRVDSSAVFLCTAPISNKEISRVIDEDLTPAQLVAVFDRCMERVPVGERSILELTRIVLRGLLGEDVDLLRRDLTDFHRKGIGTSGLDPDIVRDMRWIEQLFMSPERPAHGGGLDFLSTLGR